MRLVALLLLAASPAIAATPRTFRVDYFHTGSDGKEIFSLDRLVVEPLPWPGNPARPIDDTDSGKYRFLVRDAANKTLLYSRGFSSIFGEWEDTQDAKDRARTFEESLRFPLPPGPVEVTLEKRDRTNSFVPVWAFKVDPKDQTVSDAVPDSPGPLLPLLKSGPSESKVDLLILGDGYTKAQRGKFEKDARRLVSILFSKSPFKERKQDFNVWGLCPESRESGISRPSTGVHRRSRIGATYDAFGSERYVLTFDNRSFRDVASFAPYEFVEILVNGNTYGGGGIFGLYSTVAADSLWAPYVFVHEFGHHFAGLADEYYTSDTALLPAAERLEPWEPNVTALKDPAQLKWKSLVSPGTPVPTPWRKEEFETFSRAVQAERRKIRADRRPESEMDALFTREMKEVTRILDTDQSSGKVGAFEGAMYESRGYFRPEEDCIMFTRDQVPFCRVCQAALSRIIDLYSRGPAR
jgi:hypothetical protein